MIVTSHSNNVLSGTSGEWRIWSLSDGYIEMPANLLRDPSPGRNHGYRIDVKCSRTCGIRTGRRSTWRIARCALPIAVIIAVQLNRGRK